MIKKCIPILLAFVLCLSACGTQPGTQPTEETGLTIAAMTYPVYLLTCEVTKDVPDVTVKLVINQPVSCVHDYSLSVNDMKTLEGANVIALSGAGLEASMENALSAVAETPQIDCSEGLELLTMAQTGHFHGEEAAEHEGDADPHFWLDPVRATVVLDKLADRLAEVSPENKQAFQDNAARGKEALLQGYETMKADLQDLSLRELITFHDGFQYFAQAFDLTILRSIEEEAGSEASAQEVGELLQEINTHHLPAVFTEKNGATATAEMLQRETGVAVKTLDLMMSGETENVGVSTYLTLMQSNVDAIREVYS